MATRTAARRTQAERSAATREALVEAARKLFARRGYFEVGSGELVRACRLTRGALYHHFDGKQGLFEAVVESVQAEVTRDVERAAAAAPGPWEGIKAGCAAFVRATARPEVMQILLVDAVAVLGIMKWRAIDAEYGLASLQAGLAECMELGVLPEQPVEPLARLISGAVNEAALWLAEKTKSGKRRSDVPAAVDALLDGLA